MRSIPRQSLSEDEPADGERDNHRQDGLKARDDPATNTLTAQLAHFSAWSGGAGNSALSDPVQWINAAVNQPGPLTEAEIGTLQQTIASGTGAPGDMVVSVKATVLLFNGSRHSTTLRAYCGEAGQNDGDLDADTPIPVTLQASETTHDCNVTTSIDFTSPVRNVVVVDMQGSLAGTESSKQFFVFAWLELSFTRPGTLVIDWDDQAGMDLFDSNGINDIEDGQSIPVQAGTFPSLLRLRARDADGRILTLTFTPSP